MRVAPYVDLSGRWAGSGYLSTAEDLVRLGAAHTRQGLLSTNTLALVAERDSLADGRLTNEGFGWGPRSDWDGRPMLWGDGGTPGSRCGLLVYPEDGLAIAVLTNARGLALERGEFQTLARLFLGPRQGQHVLPPPAQAVGKWNGTVAVGAATVDVDLVVENREAEARGQASFKGWRSFKIADVFRFGDTTWLVPLDRQGMFPITFTLEGDSMNATAPRADWSFRLAHSTEELQGGR